MNRERLFLIDPFDEDHKKIIENFEKENNLKTITSTFIRSVSNISKEKYDKEKKYSNETRDSLYLQIEEKKDLCFIMGEKDIKTCHIIFAPVSKKIKVRKLLGYATDYAKNTLGMKEIFVKTQSDDKSMIENLKSNGYESLGTENGEVIYLKEIEEKLENQRKKA